MASQTGGRAGAEVGGGWELHGLLGGNSEEERQGGRVERNVELEFQRRKEAVLLRRLRF